MSQSSLQLDEWYKEPLIQYEEVPFYDILKLSHIVDWIPKLYNHKKRISKKKMRLETSFVISNGHVCYTCLRQNLEKRK